MKKFLVIALAVVMMMSTLAISAFAKGEVIADNGTHSTDITINTETQQDTVYYVDITWDGNETFSYKTTNTWDANNHKYTTTKEWIGAPLTVEIINHSNTAIEATFSESNNPGVTLDYAAVTDGGHGVTTIAEKVVALGNAAEGQSLNNKDSLEDATKISIKPTGDYTGTQATIGITVTITQG